MKITFNDGQELQIQQVVTQTDGALLIKTISATEDQLKTLFSDSLATKKMTVSERGSTDITYENYTKLDAIVKYTAGIFGVMLYREGETPEDKLATLAEKYTELQDNVNEAVAELTMALAAMQGGTE